MSKPYQLSSSPFIYLHEVIVPCTCIKSPITFCYQILLLLTLFCFLNLILASGIPIKYSSVTTKFLSISYYQLLLSPCYSVATQTTSYRYSLSVTSSYSHQLLLSATRNRQSYYSLLYQLLLSTSHFSYYFQVLLADNTTYSYQLLVSTIPIRHLYQLLVSTRIVVYSPTLAPFRFRQHMWSIHIGR